MSVHYRYRYPFVTANAENLHTGDARGTPINPYSRLAFAKGLHARLGAGADSVLAHLREELLCEQIVSTTVRAVRQDIHGHTYEGEWKDGKRHGQGKFTYASGDTYEGEWKDGNEHGQGRLTYPNGYTYEGEYKDGYQHGQGKYTDADGSTYEGEWKDDKKHGQGKFTYADGTTYEGEFKDGKYHGQGKLTNRYGDIYEGEWKCGMKHGQGKETHPDGFRVFISEGRWEDDDFIG